LLGSLDFNFLLFYLSSNPKAVRKHHDQDLPVIPSGSKASQVVPLFEATMQHQQQISLRVRVSGALRSALPPSQDPSSTSAYSVAVSAVNHSVPAVTQEHRLEKTAHYSNRMRAVYPAALHFSLSGCLFPVERHHPTGTA
jgi:hypothetical protein